MKSRQTHMNFCKDRALEYLDRGDAVQAVTSMLSDLSKHPETEGIGEKLAGLGMLAVMSNDHKEARKFIEGFN